MHLSASYAVSGKRFLSRGEDAQISILLVDPYLSLKLSRGLVVAYTLVTR